MEPLRWQYCLVTCTPMSGLDDDGYRVSCRLFLPGGVQSREVRSGEPSPLAAMGRLLNELGEEGWELVSYEPSTNRGVMKRPALGRGGSHRPAAAAGEDPGGG